MATNNRVQSRKSSTQSSQASYPQDDTEFSKHTSNEQSAANHGSETNVIENMIDDIKDGINQVAHQLSHGMSFEEDKENKVDSPSEKSLSSLESDMAAKLAQPDLVPPDVTYLTCDW